MNKAIGIIGGLGPYAGLDLFNKILNNTNASTDIDHLPIVLYSKPQLIPDRTEFLLGRSTTNPAYGILTAISDLEKTGTNIISIACNAAHAPEIFNVVKDGLKKRNSKTILVSIIDETVNYISENHPSIKKVGILSITGTYKSMTYEKAFINRGVSVVRADEKTQGIIHESIWNSEYGIKAFSNPVSKKATDILYKVLNYFKSKGAEAIILGCTEIPLAIKDKKFNDMLIFDASEILAKSLIKKIDHTKLK